MKCDSWASFLAYTFASPCLGRKPKAKVMTKWVLTLKDYGFDIVHKVNKVNQNADCLSQNPSSNEENIINVQ
jgi:hypothetical protein